MMRKYLAAGALGASLLGLGVAGAPIASAHGNDGGRDGTASHQERGGERSRDGRRGDDGRRDHGHDRGGVGVRDGRDGRGDENCDDEGQAPELTPPPTAPAATDVGSNGKGPGGEQGAEKPRDGIGFVWDVLSTTLGVSSDDIRARLAAGESVDDIAATQGVAPTVVHDALTAGFDQKVDKAVAEGRLSAEQAEGLKSALDTFVAYATALRFIPEVPVAA